MAMKIWALVSVEYKRDFHQDIWRNQYLRSRHASGNHYFGKELKPWELIDDETRMKDVFMLKIPTDAPRELAHLFDYQLTMLNSIRVDDEGMEMESA